MRERIPPVVLLCILLPGLFYLGHVDVGFGVVAFNQHVPYSSRIPLTKAESVLVSLGGAFLLFVLYNIVTYYLSSPDETR